MKNQIKAKVVKGACNLPEEIKSNPDTKNSIKSVSHEYLEKELNSKILEVTMKIRYHYPELSKYLDEIPVTISSEKDRQITLSHLKEYYDSLSSILNKYKLTYPKIAG
jgi:hypothetical protein